MNAFWAAFGAFSGGAALGFAFFGNLFWMARRLGRMKRPLLMMMLGFFLRIGVAVFCFIWMIHAAAWTFAAIFLTGFLTAKVCFLCKQRIEKVHD